MNPILVVLPLALTLTLYSAYLRLSARIRHSEIRWKDALVFAAAVGTLAVLGRVLTRFLGGGLPVPFSIFLGAGLHLAFGAWFFGTRARGPDGRPLGWRRAVEVLTLTLVLFLATGFLLFAVTWILSSHLRR